MTPSPHTAPRKGLPLKAAGPHPAQWKGLSPLKALAPHPTQWKGLLFAFLIVALFGTLAEAATQKAPAYLVPQIRQNDPWSWTEGLSLFLNIDEKTCRAKYGKKWREACTVHPGEEGAEARELRFSPAVPGRWIWQDSRSLRFTPREPLKPGETYTLALDGLRLPPSIRLTSPRATFRANPLAVRLQSSRLWIDPSPKAAHVVTASFQFSSRVGEELPCFDYPEGGELELGAEEYVWNSSRDRVNVSAPVKKLPDGKMNLDIVVPGILPYFLDDQGTWRLPPNTKQSRFSMSLPGQKSLFKVERMEIRPAVDGDLNQGYELEVRTSLHARPGSVLEKLSLVQLPRSLDPAVTRPYNWRLAPSVPAPALNRGRKIKPVSLQPDDTPVSAMRFRVDVDPESYVLIYLAADCTSATGLPLAGQWREIVQVSPSESNLHFLQPGNVLPLRGERKLDLYSSDLDEIRWEVSRVRDPFLALLAEHSYAPLSQGNGSYLVDSTSLISRGRLPLKAEGGKAQFSRLDLAPLMKDGDDGSGLMLVHLEGYRDKEHKTSASRLILVTDLGLIAKQSTSGCDVFVTSIQQGGPVADVPVEILGLNGRPVARSVTDAQGRAVFPPLQGLQREQRPVAITAKRGEDLAWLPLDDAGLVQDASAYPVSGRSLSPDGLVAYVFPQRGIFRPGETLRFGVLTRRGDWKPVPDDLPLTARLHSPSGRELMKRSFGAAGSGLAELAYETGRQAQSGIYRLDVSIEDGPVLGTCAVRVEEFQPDTMAISAKMRDPLASQAGKGWIRTSGKETPEIEVALRTLSGIQAAGHRVSAQASITPAHITFRDYAEYTFHDALPFKGNAVECTLDGNTDENGQARLPLPQDLTKAGTVQASFLVEGFEADGGRAVSVPLSALMSPLERMVGWKPAGSATNPEFILQGANAALDFIAVDADLKRVGVEALNFTVYARRTITSLVTDSRGEYRYEEEPLDRELFSSTHSIPAGESLRWNFPTKEAGDYLLAVRDGRTTLALVPFTVAGERLALKDDDSLAPGSLRLKLDKSAYRAGENIQLFVQVPYDGSGLITLERDGVAASTWFTARAGESVQRIAVPAGFEGRGFVNVTFMRSASSPDIYRQSSVFAIAPFMAQIQEHNLGLRLKAPERILPGEAMKVHLEAREKSQVLVFAVDEGVLQLTRFATPSPLHALLEDRALDVRTRHALNRLMPDHALLQGRIPAFGGGMDLIGGRFHNPFRRQDEPPLATWTLTETGPGGSDVSIDVPSYYTGSVRVMAVGAAPKAVASSAANTQVSAPLMLTPRLPLTVSPGDRFTGTLTLANSTDADMEVSVSAQPAEGLRLAAEAPVAPPSPAKPGKAAGKSGKPEPQAGAAAPQKKAADPGLVQPRRVTVKAGGERVLSFNLAANEDFTGASSLSFTASGPGQNATRSAGISIRPLSHQRVSQQAGRTQNSLEIVPDRDLYPYEASRILSVSGLPLPLMQGLSRFLELYPHGCLEQLVSRAMGVALVQKNALSRDAQTLVEAAVAALRQNGNHDGLSLWPGWDSSLLLTAYGADLLLTLREQGLGIPEPLLSGLCDTIENRLPGIDARQSELRAAAYGIWVLTREGRVTTQALERLRQTLDENGIDWSQDVTAALFAASQRIMRMRDKAIVPFSAPTGASDDPWFDALASQALYTTLIARHFPERMSPDLAEDMAESTMEALRSGRYATFSAAQAIRALASLQGSAVPALEGVRLLCAESAGEASSGETSSGKESAVSGLWQLNAPLCSRFHLDLPEGSEPVYWQLSSSGFDRQLPARAESVGLTVERVYRNRAGEAVTSASQGEELSVTITARADGGRVRDAVILDLLPGGMEMILPRPGDPAPQEEAEGNVHTDRRDDRMILFTDLGPEPFTFSYRVRAVNKGVFALPAAQAEAMYDPSRHASTGAGRFEIR